MMTSNKKMKIALYSNVYDTTVGQSIAYMELGTILGEVVLVHSENDFDRVIKECDVLLVPGGADILSLSYKKSPGWAAGKANAHYEYLDSYLLKPWIVSGKPIVAICRGMQVLNVVMGGSLHTDVIGHQQSEDRNDASEVMYTVFPSHRRVLTNSFHHQALDEIAPGFEVIGWSDVYYNCPSIRPNFFSKQKKTPFLATRYVKKKDSKILEEVHNAPCFPEIIRHKTLPFIGFQYHPEEMLDEFSLSLMFETINQHTTHNYAQDVKEKSTQGKAIK